MMATVMRFAAAISLLTGFSVDKASHLTFRAFC
jgi:hypothetical protein